MLAPRVPPPPPRLSQPSVPPYKHTKLSVSDSSSRQQPVLWHQPRSPAPDDNAGRPDRWHHQPTSERCHTVSSHRGGFESCAPWLQPQRPNGYSGLGTEREREGEREFTGTAEELIDFTTLKFRSPPTFLSLHLSISSGCEQLWVFQFVLHTTQQGSTRWPGMTDIWQRGDRRGTQRGKVQHKDEWQVEIRSPRIEP